MSELANVHADRTNFRWQLLASASAIALIGFVCESDMAIAADADSDRPPLWIELGGQLNQMEDSQEAFVPAFPNSPARPSIFSPSQKFERLPLYSIDETGGISFEPDSSNWVFSASVRYGRSSSDKHIREQTYPQSATFFIPGNTNVYHVPPLAQRFADTNVENSEHHLIADFQAGKDVGLGMFGDKNGSSIVGLGVRFAQFNAKSNIAIKSNPDWQFIFYYYARFKENIPVGQPYHTNAAGMQSVRSFHGIGPSISWNASAPFLGNPQTSELAVDWGVNAAVLFGRQRTRVSHHATGRYHSKYAGQAVRPITYQPTPVSSPGRAKTVTVPNVGGFLGFSFRYAAAKVSFGYRGDFFFGAMDGGIDAAKKENVGFYGPFASVSVGIGG
jgi:hypothetical protein